MYLNINKCKKMQIFPIEKICPKVTKLFLWSCGIIVRKNCLKRKDKEKRKMNTKLTNALQEAKQRKKVLIAAHRGVSGGNIPFNTMKAFDAALCQGADILETDITSSKDGKLFIFHPKQEINHLNLDIHLEQMTGEEICKLRYVNFDNALTEYEIPTLDDFLEAYKNRCIINLDHAWDDLPKVIDTVRRHGMEEQILMKAPAKIEYAKMMEELAPKMMFMPIFKEKDALSEQLENMKINFAGSELVFAKEDSVLAQDDYLELQHKRGRLLWVNAILYSYKAQLSGGHTDDIAVSGDPEYGWKWLIDKGFDIIQTDWVMPLHHYISSR